MATRCAAASTNWTTSTTWATIDATSFSNSESANTALTTSFVESTGATTGAITVDAILVKIASRNASPTGTMTVHLAVAGVEVTGTAVTVNVSDLPTCTATTGTTTPVATAEGGWFCLKFAAPVLLLVATSYTVGAKTSSSSQVNLWSAATTNWSRALRTTATANMAAGDDAIITKEWVSAGNGTARAVTMNETATTAYGSNTTSQVTPSLAITQGGTLTFSTGIAANLRQLGYVIVYNGGTLNIGASGAEVGRSSTAVLQFACTADGDFGLVARRGATVTMAGLSRTSAKIVSQTKLNADAASSATSITIVDDTGWLSGDTVCLAPTTQTNTQFESKALTGNATATTAAISALTNAHSGTSPTQAEVGLLTRNVQFTAVTANTVTFFYVADTATVSCSWTDFRYISTNATGKRGIEINTTTGSCTIDYCSIRDADACWWYITGATASNITITNTVHYNGTVASNAVGCFQIATATSGTWTVSNNMFCGATTASSTMGILSDIGGTFTNNSLSGNTAGANGALQLAETGALLGTFSGLSVHSNASIGIRASVSCYGTISTSNVWRNNADAVQYTVPINQNFTLLSCNIFGNNGSGITTLTASQSTVANLILDNCTFNGDTTFGQTNGIFVRAGTTGNIYLYSSQFSVVSGIKTKQTNDMQFDTTLSNALVSRVFADNTILNGTNVYAAVNTMAYGAFLSAQNFGQTANDNRTYIANGSATPGLIQSNTGTVYGSNTLSEQMTPGSTTVKLVSQSIFVECASGKAATPVIQVRKDGTYNGSAPRLILKRQDSMGVTIDTVLDTLSVGVNTWEALTGTTGLAPQKGIFEFVIDCDGTAGSAFVGDATATTA